MKLQKGGRCIEVKVGRERGNERERETERENAAENTRRGGL